MTNPIEKALNRLHEYAILHPEHDTAEILKNARTYFQDLEKENLHIPIEKQ